VITLAQTLSPGTVTAGALLPRVLIRGTRSLPDRTRLAEHLEDLFGAALGATSFKLGDHQVIEATFSSAGPGTLGERDGDRLVEEGTRLAVELLADPARLPQGPGLREDYVAEEKDLLARDIAAIADDRLAYAHFRCLEEMCRGEPFALHSLGRAEDLPDLSAENLDAFRRSLLRTAPLTAYLIGRLDGRLAERVAAALTVLGGGGVARRKLPPPVAHPPPWREKEVFEQAEVTQARLVVGLQTGVTPVHPLFPAAVLWNGLLGGFVHSRLFRKVREERGLAYYAWSRLLAVKGVILISCGIEDDNYRLALDLVKREVDQLSRGSFSEAELEATRNSAVGVALAQLDSPTSLVYGHLERRAAGLDLTELAPWRALERTTPEEVREFGRRVRLDTVYLLGRRRPPGAGEEATRDAARV